MNWHDYFEYQNGNLIWKVPRGKKIKAGAIAGTLTPKGYIAVLLNGKRYQAHRIIWEMLVGPIPVGMEIDHIDGRRHINLITNLRLVDRSGNSKNRAMRSDNTSGATGVYQDSKSGNWIATVRENGKNKYLGSYLLFADAVVAREQYNKIAGYSARHGK